MDATLDDLYLEWLYKQIESDIPKAPSKSYWKLFHQLYTKEFIWLVPNDDNRVEDGRDLRYKFIDSEGIDQDDKWLALGCSVLEMIIALSDRCAFETDTTIKEWFWRLMNNLELLKFNDSWYRRESNAAMIDERLNRLVQRKYYYDGSFGGLFPLQHPPIDQRDVEIWYQMNTYLLENE